MKRMCTESQAINSSYFESSTRVHSLLKKAGMLVVVYSKLGLDRGMLLLLCVCVCDCSLLLMGGIFIYEADKKINLKLNIKI
ncbi:hypothetical protein BpHYR1_048822 [Brachionus plicatilis]|uniref:Uncharacterized protein n=1 Tax=Brachionus plicatilis TaxID=10195 RepID=A0A3M7QYI2_BRAPC|nr:hypothetical protein BpHYR1_048822 [Brachionus plicatilis]